MLQSIVGPPMVGATDLKSSPERTVDKDFKGSGSESSFGKALEEKITSKDPKEVKDSPQREMKPKDQDDPKPQQAEAKKTEEVSKPDGKISKKATVRQKAIQEFMDSFESEFEISPTRLVEAMAQLDDKQLAQSPEATANAVIEQLGLSDEDADKAQAMYVALLTQLNQMPQQQQPKPAPEMAVGAGMSQQHMQARIAAAQGKQDAMGASVDRLNKSFWMRQEPKAAPTDMPSLDASLAQRMMMDDSSSMADIAQDEMPMEVPETEMPQTPPAAAQGPKLEELPPHLQGQMKEAMSPALLAALAAKQAAQAKQAQEQAATEENPALMDEFQQAAQAPKLERAPIAMQGQIPNVQNKASQEFFQNQSQGQSFMQQNSQEPAAKMMTGGKEAATKLVEKAADFKSSLTGLEGIHGAPIKGETLGMNAAAPMAAAAPTAPANPAENEAAVKQLMNQAQYLIKKGGGEMKVQMTPEGMGTIHLKVMLQDGKVNLQMSADTQEAKKTIESSLAELKTSLAAHKLSMENVKVDVVNSASADTATQNQTNMNGQNQRDQNRQFWNQFNENFGSQGRKESFLEMPNLKGYGNRGRDPLQPIETSSTARARNVEGKGSGLNLVA
ncbi:flagellar hook-length control protein FliK [Bdellovibrio sp. BCCA]|uniref:flagellar hook-length control protein FliK n=1 Tax=Bdellovibrio sp. BCCA TaxID=3136281 RepID=UPI0030F1948D